MNIEELKKITGTYDPIQDVEKGYEITMIAFEEKKDGLYFTITIYADAVSSVAVRGRMDFANRLAKNDYATTIFSIITKHDTKTYIVKENDKIQKIMKLDEDMSYTSDELFEKDILIKVKCTDGFIYVNKYSKIYDMYLKGKVDDESLYNLSIAQAYIDNTTFNRDGKKVLAKRFTGDFSKK